LHIKSRDQVLNAGLRLWGENVKPIKDKTPKPLFRLRQPGLVTVPNPAQAIGHKTRILIGLKKQHQVAQFAPRAPQL